MTGLVFKFQHMVDEKPEYYLNRKRKKPWKKWHFEQNAECLKYAI